MENVKFQKGDYTVKLIMENPIVKFIPCLIAQDYLLWSCSIGQETDTVKQETQMNFKIK